MPTATARFEGGDYSSDISFAERSIFAICLKYESPAYTGDFLGNENCLTPADPLSAYPKMLTVTQSYLTEMVRRLIGDASTSTAIRNECHRLLMAIEGNHYLLIEESLERLRHLTDAGTVKGPH